MAPAVPIPDYQTLIRPLLAAYEDGRERSIREVRDRLATEFALTPAELEQRLPSGRSRTFVDRVSWATTYLYRAGLLERSRRPIYRITERGRAVLDRHPDRIDNRVLSQYVEFRRFIARNSNEKDLSRVSDAPKVETVGASVELDATPEERIEAAHRELRSALAADLIDRVMEQSPEFFERLVMDVLSRMGYGRGQHLGGTGDEGFDGVIDEDRLGLDRIYVQAKRWTKPVGRPAVQAFVGALAGRGATKGVLITTSSFSEEARRYVDKVQARVVLIDGQELARLMIDYDVGVSVASRYDVKRVDLDYFAGDGILSADDVARSGS